MSTALLNLISQVLPNFRDKQLRAMVPWFKRVSSAVDDRPIVVAAAHVDGGGNFQKRFGFNTPVVHGSTGNFRFTFTDTQDVNLLIPMVALTGQGTPAGAIIGYPNLVDGDTIDVNIWQIAVTTAARTQVDHDFYLLVTLLPTP
jgi:hypothetical protein